MHPGDIIAGKYRVANVLGRGRGLLLEARHTEFDQRVVVRLLSPHLCDEKQLEQFRREARTLSKLESEHVARILDVGTHSDGSFFFVRQYLEGIDLAAHMARQGALRLEEAVLYLLQAAEAVQEAHSHRVVLRELQPAHLFLTRRRGGAPLVKVTDFGTAKVLKDPGAIVVDGEMTATVMFGMSRYSSPELVRKARDIDGRTDVWSLGCILYEMLTVVTPFQGEMAELMLKITREEPIPIRQLRPDLPPELDQIIGWALAKDRSARFASVYALAHALKPYASAEGQVLIDQIGRLAHAEPADDPRPVKISPTSPLARRPLDDEDRTMMRPLPSSRPGASGRSVAGAHHRLPPPSAPGSHPGSGVPAEHDFERTQFMGHDPGGSVPPPPPSRPVPPASAPGFIAPPGSHPGSVPPPPPPSAAPVDGPGSVPPPPRVRQGSWVEVDPALDRAAAAASVPATALAGPSSSHRRALLVALAAVLVLLPLVAGAAYFGFRDEGEERADATTSEGGVDVSTAPVEVPTSSPASPAADLPDGDNADGSDDPEASTDEPKSDDEDSAEDDDGDDDDQKDEDGSAKTVVSPSPAEPRTPRPRPRPVATPRPKPAPAPAPAPAPTKKKKKKKKKKKPAPAEEGGTGTLVAIAIGGTCAFAVDGAPRGSGKNIRVKVPVGRHTVSCTPANKSTRTQSVNVKAGKPGVASFRLN
ncbi:MAG: serine/threonine-protein kinase [Myxococcota bacterium]